jgi:hypothetical protein
MRCDNVLCHVSVISCTQNEHNVLVNDAFGNYVDYTQVSNNHEVNALFCLSYYRTKWNNREITIEVAHCAFHCYRFATLICGNLIFPLQSPLRKARLVSYPVNIKQPHGARVIVHILSI